MREAAFHRQNEKKWREFEALLRERERVDPDRLADLYVEVTEDLAFARSFYPESRTTAYLNALAVEIHGTIYRRRREQTSRIITFWRDELPLLIHRHRSELIVSSVIFSLAMAIGALSAALDDRFVRLILGDAYVNQTLENIAQGEPMAIYGSHGELDSFMYIMFNNVMVSFNTFASGLLFSVGTAVMLIRNGVMVGAFEYFIYEQGVPWQSALSIWVHGTLELTAIVVAGAAGLVLGNSFLFPGTYTRLQSLRRGAVDGVKLAIGLAPVFVVAAFIEGFLTRHADVNPVLGIAIIVASACAVIWYFAVYPKIQSRRAGSTARSGDSRVRIDDGVPAPQPLQP